jgi:hypothetical protein
MIFIVLYLFCCLLIAVLGTHKPLGFWGYFLGSLLLTPVIGLLLIAAAGENRFRRSHRDSHPID